MKKLRAIIVDDEPLARKGISEYLQDVDFMENRGEFDTPVNAAAIIASGEVDVMFLDIQMPKISGLDFFKSLQHPPPVIFTTAFPQFALDGFEVNAIDYLVKPISFQRFLTACMKLREYYEVRQKNTEVATKENEEYFFIKADSKLVKIFYKEILFIEALQNYVSIQLAGKKVITYLTLKSIEEYLPSSTFIKTHKSFIVSAPRIDTIEGNEIIISGYHIPISRINREEIVERLLKGRFLKR